MVEHKKPGGVPKGGGGWSGSPGKQLVKLREFALARSGDKGDGSNVGIFVRNEADYALIRRVLTPERVKQHFRRICKGEVIRYEVPNMLGLNFILRDSLGGGGSESLKTDAQGKTHGLALLELEVER
jgi:hypothetical protein